MCAAVDEGVDRADRPGGYDDGDLAEGGGYPVAGIGDLTGEAQIIPGRALEDPLLLEPVLLRVGVDAEGNLAERVGRERHAALEAGILHGHGSALFGAVDGPNMGPQPDAVYRRIRRSRY